ncbi:MAG: hypothetical protein WCT46_02355 [Candidatus Gracilibacteria bacterium]|jgi:hypothetical protein
MPKKDYSTSWSENNNAQKIRKSAVELAISICASGGMEKHKKELLSCLIWKTTEASGKYNTRYVSKGVFNGGFPVEHEHVFTRKTLVEKMLRNPEDIRLVIDEAVACLVTKEEHGSLSKSNRDGWERYEDIGIKIYDRLKGKWIGTWNN